MAVLAVARSLGLIDEATWLWLAKLLVCVCIVWQMAWGLRQI